MSPTLRRGRILVLYVPPDLEPGEAATAHALDLPDAETWTREEFRAAAQVLLPQKLEELHRVVMARRREVADRVWRLLGEVVELGGRVTVSPNLQGSEVLTIDFFPESLDTEEWWGVELLSFNVAIDGPTVPGGLWGVASSIVQNCGRGLELRRDWLKRRAAG